MSTDKVIIPVIEPTDPKQTKMDRFIDLLDTYVSWHDAARAAGFSEKSVKNIKGLVKQSKKARDRIKAKYEANSVIALHDIAEIESRVLERVKEDIDSLPKFRHTLKEIKQSAGVIKSEHDHTGPVMINVEKLQVAMRNKYISQDKDESG